MSDFIDRIKIIKGDITKQTGVDAIVCGVYPDLALEGSLNAAVMAAADGPLDEAIHTNVYKPRIGDAFAMPPFGLPVWHIIYTVTPRWRDGFYDEEAQLLRSFRAAMALAQRMQLKSIAFPALGAGRKKFPVARAARIALKGITDRQSKQLHEIRIVCNRDDVYDAFVERLAGLASDGAMP